MIGLPKLGASASLRAARNHGLKNFCAEQIADFADDFVGQFRAAVEHRHHDAENFEARIDAGVAQLAEHAVHHRDAFERVILALQRHENAVARGKGVQRENAERRRAINQNHVKPSAVAARAGATARRAADDFPAAPVPGRRRTNPLRSARLRAARSASV